jgi:hypothetical protein
VPWLHRSERRVLALPHLGFRLLLRPLR